MSGPNEAQRAKVIEAVAEVLHDAGCRWLGHHVEVSGEQPRGYAPCPYMIGLRTLAERALQAAAPHMLKPGTARDVAVGAVALSKELADRADAAERRSIALAELAAEMLASYHKGSDGYRGRVGQVQIAKWQARLGGDDAR